MDEKTTKDAESDTVDEEPDAIDEEDNIPRRWVAVAGFLLVVVRPALSVTRLDSVQRFATAVARVGAMCSPTLRPEAVGRLVASIGYRIPGTKCLAMSVTARALLDAQGHDADLKIGVQKWDGGFYAHAWVESDGQTIVGGEVDTANYDELVGTDRTS